MKKLNVPALVAMTMLTLSVCQKADAQISAGLTLGVGIPSGEFADKAKGGATTGFGGGLQGRYMINENFHAGIGLGYYTFTGPEADLSGLGGPKITSNYTVMPITLSADYYFLTDDFKPFATIDLGMYRFGTKVESSAYTSSGVAIPAASADTSETKFGFGFGLGAAYALADNFDLLGSIKYNSFSASSGTVGWIGINVGIAMKFGDY